MNNIKKIVGINMIILVIYTILVNIANRGGSEAGLGIALGLASLIFFQVITNVIMCLICFGDKKSELGKAYLLSAGMVLLIGFSSCWLSASSM